MGHSAHELGRLNLIVFADVPGVRDRVVADGCRILGGCLSFPFFSTATLSTVPHWLWPFFRGISWSMYRSPPQGGGGGGCRGSVGLKGHPANSALLALAILLRSSLNSSIRLFFSSRLHSGGGSVVGSTSVLYKIGRKLASRRVATERDRGVRAFGRPSSSSAFF